MIILLLDERQFGVADAYIINSWNEAENQWIFPNLVGGLSQYRAQLPINAAAPILIFDHLSVTSKKDRRQGLGSAGMLLTMRYFRSKGARVAFLRIATQDDDWYKGKIWRQKMYEKLGWIVLDNHDSEQGDVPIMWHPMRGDLSCPRIDEVELSLDDEDLNPIPFLDI